MKFKMNAKILFLTIFLFPHISLTGQTSLEIWEIQGSDLYSDYQGQTVATNENIVVSIGLDRFFMQTPTVRSDDNPMTSDGILVYTGSTPQVEVGDLVSFNATVQEFNNVTQLSAGGVSINILANNQALPSMATLDENFPSSTIQEVPDLEHVESMLVMVANGTICGPTSYNGLGYATAGSSRSFREAGVESPGIFGLPVFDGNPELFRIDTEDFISSRARFFASGIIYQDDDEYVLKADVLNILSEDPEVSVREKNPEEFTIGSLNCLGLDNTEEDFVTRSRKLSKYITDLMRSPDVIAVQEVRDLATLEALAVRMHLENPSILYDAYLEEGNSFGDFVINNGYLVNSIYQDIAITQLGKDIFFQFDREKIIID